MTRPPLDFQAESAQFSTRQSFMAQIFSADVSAEILLFVG
jgi:hypothetical protein